MYRQQFAVHGMTFSGTSPDGSLVEIIELVDHPWFLAVQYHPEFKSKPTKRTRSSRRLLKRQSSVAIRVASDQKSWKPP